MDICVTEVCNMLTVHSLRGVKEKMENRSHFGLSFCRSGKIIYTSANGKTTLSDNMRAVILPKGGNYKIQREESGLFPVINFEATGLMCDAVLAFPISNIDVFFGVYEKTLAAFENRQPLLTLSCFYRLLSLILEGGNDENGGFAVDFIRKNLSDAGLTGKKIAEHFFISESYMNRLFVKAHGITPRKYIIEKRMELAEKLLEDDKIAVTAVSEKCGYTSVYSFSRAFRDYFGNAPMSYRKNLRKERM